MRQITSLIWKEWHETRGFLFIGLGVFLGLPLVGAIEAYAMRLHTGIIVTPWVSALSGVLAVFVGVGVSCRDLSGRLEDFWRSRPLNVARWLMVKYFVGLATVMVSCGLPLVAELLTTREHSGTPEGAIVLAWGPFFWIALYSMAFLVGVLVRRPAHAAMLALSAMLLLYFLPVVIPPLQFLSVTDTFLNSDSPRLDPSGKVMSIYHAVPWIPWRVYFEPAQLLFAGGMIGIGLFALVIALLAARRNWRIEAGRKLMYWSIGMTVLILFASAAFQLATNLPVLQTIELPGHERIIAIECDGTRGVLLSTSPNNARPFQVTPAGIQVGPPTSIGGEPWFATGHPPAVWLAGHPDLLYVLAATRTQNVLSAIRLDGHGFAGAAPALPIGFGDLFAPLWTTAYSKGERLFLASGSQISVIDLHDPERPELLQKISQAGHSWIERSSEEGIQLALDEIPELSPAERLALSGRRMEESGQGLGLNGQVLYRSYGNFFFQTDRLAELTSTHARFERVGQYQNTLLDQIFGVLTYRVYPGPSGHAYLSNIPDAQSLRVARLTVMDAHDPHRPTPIAHFAVPENEMFVVRPLPDGRALVAGNKLYLLGPPPR